jgi:hypothetical protein
MKKSLVIHPFLFAIFPILFLLSHNIKQTSIDEIVIPTAITISFTFMLWSLLNFVFKNKKKAGLLVSLFLLLFFSYGHIYNAIENTYIEIGGVVIGPNKVLFPILGILFFLSTYFCIKTRRNLHNLTNLLNIAAASLVVISLINIGTYKLKTGVAWQDNKSTENIKTNLVNLEKPAMLPDIYYIILDGYARADILKEVYQYDNSEFLDYLVQKGFYIANKSRSNYNQTFLSLTSSLNLTYLDDLVSRIGTESDDRMPLIKMIRNNNVSSFLKQYGYLIVAFSSYPGTEIKNADIYMNFPGSLSEFQNVLINTTPIPVLLNKVLSKKGQYDLHRNQLLYIFDHLAKMTEINFPIFVFAHIIIPHPPFVFGEHGEPINPNRKFEYADGSHFMSNGGNRDEYIKNYKKQLTFINKKITEIIDDIISNSPEPPIIILQSDHGPGSMLDWENPNNTNLKERMSILNAYYLPNNDYNQLYDEITPVNTFRIIFNHYFGMDQELLKDESYFSTWNHPYKFIRITDE